MTHANPVRTGLEALLRDWAREATATGAVQIIVEHGGAAGISFGWEMQLLGKAD